MKSIERALKQMAEKYLAQINTSVGTPKVLLSNNTECKVLERVFESLLLSEICVTLGFDEEIFIFFPWDYICVGVSDMCTYI